MTPRQRAIHEQSQASDPKVSAFVEASAGSGKTKLLTDRMLRLMLGGAPPARIQCLTFTKAAAAEMALRLQHRLGDWVTLDDPLLDAELQSLEIPRTPATRTHARALFATVLDLPGGMRIGTIHAFCQSLLRRFPLEAALSPHFQLVEDTEAEAEMRTARDSVLEHADPAAIALLAGLVRADDFADLVRTLQNERTRLAPLLALPEPARNNRIRQAADVTAPDDEAILAQAMTWPGAEPLRQALGKAQAHGSPGVREKALRMLAWLSLPPAQRAAHWDTWRADLFNKAGAGEPTALSKYAADRLHDRHPDIREAVAEEQERVWRIEDARRALRCADATIALLRLAAPALAAYATQKDRAGLLDYSDLILRTERLLQDPGAAWVLYKLDGGIDHLLLDEVQDTAPEQWRIAHRLTEEFFAGHSAEPGRAGDPTAPRTFFAVGDPKQSIYSFQGADPAEFTRSRHQMATRVTDGRKPWRDVALDVSFRSTAPVLALVDATFRDQVASEGVSEGAPLQHFADRAHHAGQIELWPLAPPPEDTPQQPWTIPQTNQGLVSAPQRLAEAIAAAIARELAAQTPLLSQDRLLEPGDILILVRRRGPFANALVRALKAQKIAVAGLDRLKLTEQIAVQDVLAAADAILLPDDDLAVATTLTSPLGNISDDSLMALAMNRSTTLWSTLRDRAHERPDWHHAWTFLSRLSERADYTSPHALLAEALGPLGGRARLLARLGAEAAEPIDELLNAALAYTTLHPPGLQGFVHWLRRSGAEVKREAGGAGSAVRVMTAHGAKGLQAPLVILPDTTSLPPDRDRLVWIDQANTPTPLWSARKELRCAPVERARSHAADLRRREHNRLLYVALTRAEDRLIVCGWQPRNAPPDDSWYAMVQRGFARLGNVQSQPFQGPWPGQALTLATPQSAQPRRRPATAAATGAPLPSWAGRPGAWTPAPPPEEPPLPTPIAPSRPTAATYGPIPAARSPLLAAPGDRFARGNAAHALLQHLPDLPPAARHQAAKAYLACTPLAPEAQQTLATQILAILDNPALAPLFAPGSRAEQPVTGLVANHVVSGVIDRMAILPDRILLADFKTGRPAPETAAQTPVRYLRQLAAYRALLQDLFPSRPIQCALVWTEDARITLLPGPLLDQHTPA